MSLTLAQIQAAQQNDIAGLAAVLAEMEPRVRHLAYEAGQRVTESLATRADFEQDAREALFRALPQAEGEDADRIIGYLYTCMRDALKDRVREVRYSGADMKAMKIFMSVMGEAEGDGRRAEQLAQTRPPKGVRLGADRAFAARIAWQGPVPIGVRKEREYDVTADLAAPADEIPEVRPKVGHGAALEALKVLERYAGVSVQRMTPKAFAANLPTLVDTLEDSVVVPRDAFRRKAVLDAMAILRSAVSTTADGDLADDLRNASDEARDERAKRIGLVRAALDKVTASRGIMLMCCFGIGGHPEFGWGDKSDRAGLAAHLGYSLGTCKVNLSQAKKLFVEHYVPLVARDDDHAAELRAAAAAGRAHAGRK